MTIVIDTSVFIAISKGEPETVPFVDVMSRDERLVMSSATYVECAMVAGRRSLGGRVALDTWLSLAEVDVLPVDLPLARLAADAFARFGKGRHPAGLNFGDCFAYALARSLSAPLLFKGDDFASTDIRDALREFGRPGKVP